MAPQAGAETQHRLRDPLTGLPTRDSLEYERGTPGGARSLLVVALHDLSRVNRAPGHSEGDHVLLEVADRLTALSSSGDVVARLEGSAFAILLDDCDGRRAGARARRVTKALSSPILLGKTAVTLNLTIGTSTDSAGTQPIASMLHNAGRASHAERADDTEPRPTWSRG